jgi:bifunctional non-homologous end joining protein LigD
LPKAPAAGLVAGIASNPWLYELKLDGYRAIAFQRNGSVHLRSRNDNDLNGRCPAVVEALRTLPDDTVVDGELVAFDEEGRPSFAIASASVQRRLRSTWP